MSAHPRTVRSRARASPLSLAAARRDRGRRRPAPTRCRLVHGRPASGRSGRSTACRSMPARPLSKRRPTEGAIDHYTCSMHPSVKQAAPGNVPHLRDGPRPGHQGAAGAGRRHDRRRAPPAHRRAHRAGRDRRRCARTFRVVGHVTYDESSLADVNLKVRGWITKLYVSETGQQVTRGQTLFSLYSPELYNAEQDFLLGHAGRGASSASAGCRRPGPRRERSSRAPRGSGCTCSAWTTRRSTRWPRGHAIGERPDRRARERLHHREERRGGRVGRRRHAPLSHRRADQGVDRGPGLRGRPRARPRRASARPSRSTTSRGARTTRRSRTCIRTSTPQTRTGRVRLELANKDLDLRPGMFASVALARTSGRACRSRRPAVVYTGPRRLVFVDLGGAASVRRKCASGRSRTACTRCSPGLSAGRPGRDVRVFLIAAEARISTAAKYWDSAERCRARARGNREPSG